MKKSKSYIEKIDDTFDFLLMVRNLLEKLIPESDNEKAVELACSLAAQLIKSAIDELSPGENYFLSSKERFGSEYGDHNEADYGRSACASSVVASLDRRVEARLREFMSISFQINQ